jgi:glycosyltransferase involved in cell wall biosynthesis
MTEKDFPKLSVIIPCYNCQETLAEAVASIYTQDLPESVFEVIMVNDGSVDGTKGIMEELAKKYSNIKIFSHNENRGGGATRNTAVENSSGDIIFCLDSDDILGAGALKKMLELLIEKRCDGVGVNTSIKFKGRDINNISFTNEFGWVGEKIPFESLFQKDGAPLCPLYSTFMFTKKAWEIAGGYPTAHGFDTQGFAWRFLANGLTAYTCPNTTYLHRIAFHKSYYIREYESGLVNHNWFSVYEEFLYLFDRSLAEKILNYDLNQAAIPLSTFVNEDANLLRSDGEQWLKAHSQDEYYKSLTNDSPVIDHYWAGVYALGRDNKTAALKHFSFVYERSLRNAHLYEYLLNLGYVFELEDRKKATAQVEKLYAYRKQGGGVSLPLRIMRKIGKFFDPKFIVHEQIVRVRFKESPSFGHFLAWLWLLIKRSGRVGLEDSCHKAGPVVDVIIPTISKDKELLSIVVESLNNLCQDIGKIYIVAPADENIMAFCREKRCVFVNERDLLGFGKEKIDYRAENLDRSGWLFQQLIKLSGEKIVEQENYFILDSDTVLLKPHNMIRDGKFVFFESDEWHAPYFKAFQWMFGYPVENRLSFTDHMMMFNTKFLAEMKSEIERQHNRPWYETYIDTRLLDPAEESCVSDYDTYANWVFIRHSDKMLKLPFYNKTLDRSQIEPIPELSKKFNQLKSASFHSYR